ncbi:nucleotidyltransferase family protein [Erythrobacter ani]|uniref:Nucleotidyltransferase family protein n=1 Tax=Erythrobacter ani TaxID=2827235 RepID=A0ABS6SMU5_9SPHN|nr:nucleotidyltransferase family protein [Erythrobacter ani]MBV7266365.1 nucleotidyltransferase family protein [Erythrobacter ani]
MADGSTLAVALLAAGSSQRFGERDKLAARFRGEMLGARSARPIPREQFGRAWVICNALDHPCAEEWRQLDFELCRNTSASDGMGTSVACAARLAQEVRADGLLIVLADMPLIPSEHFEALIKVFRDAGRSCIAASSNSTVRSPPAIFGADHFEALVASPGDGGARGMLSRGVTVDCDSEWLVDIDTPEDLSRYG